MLAKFFKTITLAVVISALILAGVEVAVGQIEPYPIPTESKIPVRVYPLPLEGKYNQHYQELMTTLKLDSIHRVIILIAVEIFNGLDRAVWTEFEGLGFYTGQIRQKPVIYQKQDTVTSLPTYQLVKPARVIKVPPNQTKVYFFGFVQMPGDGSTLEESLTVYCLWRHSTLPSGLSYSVSISEWIDPASRNSSTPKSSPNNGGIAKATNEGLSIPPPKPPEPPPSFAIAPQVTLTSIFEVKFPIFALDRNGVQGLRDRLGPKGQNTTDLVWLGVSQAIEDADFEYFTAISYLGDFFAEYETNQVVNCSIIWMKRARLLFAATSEYALFGTEVHGTTVLPLDVAEILLLIAERSREIGIDRSFIGPIPKTFVIEELSDSRVRFQIESVGIRVEAIRTGNIYTVDVFLKGEDTKLKTLIYERPF